MRPILDLASDARPELWADLSHVARDRSVATAERLNDVRTLTTLHIYFLHPCELLATHLRPHLRSNHAQRAKRRKTARQCDSSK